MELCGLELFYSPFRVIFLVLWFYLCMYLVQRFEFSPIIPEKLKMGGINVLILIFGPIVIFIFVILDSFEKVQQYGMPFLEAFKRAIGRAREVVDISYLAGARGKHAVLIVDALGRNLSEVYGDAERNKDDRETIEHTQNIIAIAIEQLASDIIIEPTGNDKYIVRYKIDGTLRDIEDVENRRCAEIINSIKAISSMDIAEHGPQEGAFVGRTPGNDISFRVTSRPIREREKILIRILNQAIRKFTLADIGMDEKYQQVVREAVSKKSGMIIVCGSSGSGKSTTIQAMLMELDFTSRNVVTIENPLEYILPGVNQIEIKASAGMTVEKTLKSVLTQSPDVICVGEIANKEIASLALGASQAGHLVFATLNSDNSATAIIRLIKFGIKPILISSAIDMIISQKLVRRLCPQCKTVAVLDEAQLEKLKDKEVNINKIMQSTGCGYCGDTGYKGKTGVFDIMIHGDDVKAKILSSNFSVSKFENTGNEQHKINLKKQAIRLALNGVTSLEEIKRMTQDLER
ncbi:MAG: type II/IV secretion system protein [Sedimentisphaerales bacterium]|nr:type II/IV secretion system protein [Sedimentisphaerales bacterium]